MTIINNHFSDTSSPLITPVIEEKSFAEIIASTLDHFVAQSWKWDHFPNFGSLIQVTNNQTTIIGCVTHVETGSMDPLRSPFPYQKTELELLAEQPQIFEFLRTTFKVQILGYFENQNLQSITYQLAPKPCKIHSFVAQSSPDVIRIFFGKADYLHLLFAFAHQIPNIDELLLAIIHQLTDQKLFSQEHFESLCEMYSLLTANDYRRMKLFLQRIEQLI
ncbi:hypothetical protein JST56_03660 [Candidatus Dependentiae bacterium]|nr:hypothetical protein [Candidatus Dependentiae bacterium]